MMKELLNLSQSWASSPGGGTHQKRKPRLKDTRNLMWRRTTSSGGAPEAAAHAAPAPEAPAPEAPAPEAATPGAPAPEVPAPEAPAPKVPAPKAPAPEASAAEAHADEAPAGEAPAPDAPTPRGPEPQLSAGRGAAAVALEQEEQEEAAGSQHAPPGVGRARAGAAGPAEGAARAQGPGAGPSSSGAGPSSSGASPLRPRAAAAAAPDEDSDLDLDLDFDFDSASVVGKLAASIGSALAAWGGAAAQGSEGGPGSMRHPQQHAGQRHAQQRAGDPAWRPEEPEEAQPHPRQDGARWEPETGLRPLVPGPLVVSEPRGRDEDAAGQPALPALGASRALTRVADKERGLCKRLLAPPRDELRLAKAARKAAPETAGDKWYGLPAPKITDDVKRELRVLRLRGAYDPKRFYRSFDRSKFPKFFQFGTVQNDPLDFHGNRLTRGERKTTMTEQLLADTQLSASRKKRFSKLQEEAQKHLRVKKRKTNLPRKKAPSHRPKH